MSIRSHRVLNRLLPAGLKTALRGAALKSIPTMRHLDMELRLRNLAALGFTPAVILDVGAAGGDWARMALRCWPRARVFGFEPNERERPALERTKVELPAFAYRSCFLGARRSEVRYDDAGTQTSVLAKGDGSAKSEMLVLDELIASGEVPAPQFIKLDVQGYELEVLGGAERALRGCEGVLMEVSFLPFLDGMPLAAEVMRYMEARGFLWYDAMGIYRRVSDDALLQMDVMFLRREHPLRRGGLS